jgi:hypothetical protein
MIYRIAARRLTVPCFRLLHVVVRDSRKGLAGACERWCKQHRKGEENR